MNKKKHVKKIKIKTSSKRQISDVDNENDKKRYIYS